MVSDGACVGYSMLSRAQRVTLQRKWEEERERGEGRGRDVRDGEAQRENKVHSSASLALSAAPCVCAVLLPYRTHRLEGPWTLCGTSDRTYALSVPYGFMNALPCGLGRQRSAPYTECESRSEI